MTRLERAFDSLSDDAQESIRQSTKIRFLENEIRISGGILALVDAALLGEQQVKSSALVFRDLVIDVFHDELNKFLQKQQGKRT